MNKKVIIESLPIIFVVLSLSIISVFLITVFYTESQMTQSNLQINIDVVTYTGMVLIPFSIIFAVIGLWLKTSIKGERK